MSRCTEVGFERESGTQVAVDGNVPEDCLVVDLDRDAVTGPVRRDWKGGPFLPLLRTLECGH